MPFRVFELNSTARVEEELNKFEKTVKLIQNVWVTPITTWEGRHVFIIVQFQPKP